MELAEVYDVLDALDGYEKVVVRTHQGRTYGPTRPLGVRHGRELRLHRPAHDGGRGPFDERRVSIAAIKSIEVDP